MLPRLTRPTKNKKIMEDHKCKGMALIAGLILFAIIALTMFAGCKTKEILREVTITQHDTLYTHNTDTLVDIKVLTVQDTVRQVESHTITLNNVGDTIKEIHVYHDTEKVIVVDSTNRYKSKIDSLQSIIDKTKEQNTVKEKKVLSWYDTIMIIIKIILLTAAICFIISWATKDKKTS